MKTKIFKIGVLFIVLLFASCVSDIEPEKNETLKKQNKVSFEKLDLKDLKLNIDFSPKEILSYDFKNTTEIKNSLISDILKLNSQIKYRLKHDKSSSSINYTVIVNGDGYVITNWKFNQTANSETGKFGDPTEFDSWSCPNGFSQVGNPCFSQSCVVTNIATAMEGFSSGDTYTLILHHGGVFGGVTVCVD